MTSSDQRLTPDEWEAVWYAFEQGWKNLDDGFPQPRDRNREILASARAKLEVLQAEGAA